jgi:capsule polysaccharide export protein KpsC/LpsZ
VLQPLFKDLGLNLSLSLSNRGLKFECSTVFRLENILSLESIVIDVGMSRSLNFTKQLKLVQM